MNECVSCTWNAHLWLRQISKHSFYTCLPLHNTILKHKNSKSNIITDKQWRTLVLNAHIRIYILSPACNYICFIKKWKKSTNRKFQGFKFDLHNSTRFDIVKYNSSMRKLNNFLYLFSSICGVVECFSNDMEKINKYKERVSSNV